MINHSVHQQGSLLNHPTFLHLHYLTTSHRQSLGFPTFKVDSHTSLAKDYIVEARHASAVKTIEIIFRTISMN